MTDGDYYDIDSILCDDERISVKFSMDAINLGYLDASSNRNGTLPEGTKVSKIDCQHCIH